MWSLDKHTDVSQTSRPKEMEREGMQGKHHLVPCISRLPGPKSWFRHLLAECPEHAANSFTEWANSTCPLGRS